MFNQKIFQVRLRELRLANNLKQEELANKVGITKAAISNYENGYKVPSVDIVCLLAETLGVSTDYLLGRTDKK